MEKNVGSVDRIIRIVAAIVIAALGIYYQSWWGLLAIVPLATALLRVCPLYLPLGIKTLCQKEQK